MNLNIMHVFYIESTTNLSSAFPSRGGAGKRAWLKGSNWAPPVMDVSVRQYM